MAIVPNPASVPLGVILANLQRLHPRAQIKKFWLSPEHISIPVSNYKMMVRAQPKKGRLVVDFNPPVAWNLIGMFGFAFIVSFILSMLLDRLVIGSGALILLLGFFLTKTIFKSRHKAEIARFEQEVQQAMRPDDGSIF